MAPAGGYKGAGIGLMVELLAAAATGATLGIDASSFSGPLGGPPRTGQFFIAIEAGTSSDGLVQNRIARLCEAFAQQPGVRVPGAKKAAFRAKARARSVIGVDPELVARIRQIADAGTG